MRIEFIQEFIDILRGKKKLKSTVLRSFSQQGEDFILRHVTSLLFEKNLINNFQYLDIGANHPDKISNTYTFYLEGYNGVVVEPNKSLCKKFLKVRPKDIVLNIGVAAGEERIIDFYQFNKNYDGISTFSKETADYYKEKFPKSGGYKVIPTKIVNINNLLNKYFPEKYSLTFLNVDCESLDFDIIKSLDFEKYKPVFICVETYEPSENSKKLWDKNDEMIDYIKGKNYSIIADTLINTIFLNNEIIKGK